MKISAALAPDAIRRIFASDTTRGDGPLEVRKLYRLWGKTGLRRDDLVSGIAQMSDAHQLTSSIRDGGCFFTIAQDSPRAARKRVKLEELQLRSQTISDETIHSQDAPQQQQRRRAFDGLPPPGGERRRRQYGRLLSGLTRDERERLLGSLQLVPLAAGSVLWNAGDRIKYVYFPIDCILSSLIEFSDGHSSEISVTGNEGMAGLEACLGSDLAAYRTIVEKSGLSHRMPVSSFRQEFRHCGAFHDILLGYSHALLMQVALTAACNRHHTMERRFCRVLLSLADRMRSGTLLMTHEMLADSVGVRREGVTSVLGVLSRLGLIQCSRKKIVILDRPALESRSCECYEIIRSHFEALRPDAAESARGLAKEAPQHDRRPH